MDFLKNLEVLTKLYQELNSIMELERDALISADLAELSIQTRNKDNKLEQIRSSEKKRQLMAAAFAQSKGFAGADIRLLALADRCDDIQERELAKTLRGLHSVLQLEVEKAAELNRENEIFAGSALRILHGAMKDIKHTVTEKPTYGKRGKMAGTIETQAGNFIKREA